MYKLDVKDRKLLYELDLNSRQSFSELGKKIRLNKNTVQYRISKLLQEGVIKRFYTLIDTAKLGYLTFRVFLRFQNLTEEREREIIQYLLNNPKVGWMVSLEGNWDLNFMIWVKSHYEFDEFWHKFKFKFEENLVNKWVSLFVRLHFYSKAYLVNKKVDDTKSIILYDKAEQEIKIDDKDLVILKSLAEDARTSILEISKKANLSINIVKERIRRLKQNEIIKAYKPMIDLDKISYRYYKVHFELKGVDEKNWEMIKSFCHLHPNILDFNELINGADLELDVQVKDDVELRKFISEIRNKFQKFIKDYEVLHYYKEHKFMFFPIE